MITSTNSTGIERWLLGTTTYHVSNCIFLACAIPVSCSLCDAEGLLHATCNTNQSSTNEGGELCFAEYNGKKGQMYNGQLLLRR